MRPVNISACIPNMYTYRNSIIKLCYLFALRAANLDVAVCILLAKALVFPALIQVDGVALAIGDGIAIAVAPKAFGSNKTVEAVAEA